MTLNDVVELAKKGNELDWADFKDYNGRDVGSGLYIWEFTLEDGYVLDVGGSTDKKPIYIILSCNNEKGIDIRTDDVKEYIASSATPVESLKGDANCDGQIDLSDAVMIMQALANPNKYGIGGTAEKHLTEQGQINGDMDGDGLTVGDAQAIQSKLLGLSDTVPESSVLPQIKIYHSASVSDAKYTEMKVDEVVSIETDYNPAMSDWSGIGILLEFESKDYPITLSTNEGHFTTWDKEEGSGIVTNVGKTYDVGNSGYIFWTPDNLNFDEDFESDILITGESNGKSIEVGKIVINMNDKHTLSAVLK